MTRGCALITGGGRRLGRALGLAAARAGYHLAIHHRGDTAEADETAALARDLGVRAQTFHAELTDPGAPAILVAAAAAALGEVTLLINSASEFKDDRIGALEEAELDHRLAVNLQAPILLSDAFARQLGKGRKGLIVNMIDQRVWRPNPLFFSYSLSKAGLWWVTQTMAQGLAPDIRVNAIGPGPTLASIHQTEADFEAEAKATPLQHPASPEEIAAALTYLIDASSVTGQMIAIDAGQHLAWRTPDVSGQE
ncbi:MAG: short-chain dehydrogenase/reductase [Caulobacteraceae bacterium]|nr:short-chain dehydrogenase/reductase [Caulobacteraceae bacterium]